MKSFGSLLEIVRLSVRTDRKASLRVALLIFSSILAGTTFAIWVRLLIDAYLNPSAWAATIGLVGLGGAYFATLFLSHAAMAEASRHQPNIEATVKADIVDFVFDISDFRKLEDAKISGALKALSVSRSMLARGFLLVVQVASAYARFIVIMVLLVAVSPWLVLIALLALPSVLLAGRANQLHALANRVEADRLQELRDLFQVFSSPEGQLDLHGRAERMWLARTVMRMASEISLGQRARRLEATLLTGLSWLIYGGAFAFASWLVAVGVSNAGASDLVLVVLLVVMVRDQIGGLVALFPVISTLGALAENYSTLRSAVAAHPALPAGQSGPSGPVAIVAESMSFQYGDGTSIQDADFVIPAGSFVTICGKNGAGKSTLVKLLVGLYHPSAGVLRGVPPHRAIAAHFQDFAPLPLTIREVVGLGDVSQLHRDDLLTSAIAQAGMLEHLRSLPHGLETSLEPDATLGAPLSGGEMQGYALARAYVREQPKLRVLDEPTSAFDPERESSVLARIADRAKTDGANGVTTILVSHRMAVASRADLVIYLEEGRVLGVGTHRELYSSNAGYRELYDAQSGLYS